MKLSVLFVLFFAFIANVFATVDYTDQNALREACREINGGTKVRLEFDLSGACNGPCKKGKKKKKAAAAE